MTRSDVLYMIKRRAKDAALPYSTCCHSFRATEITAYLQNGGTLEHAQSSRRISHREPPSSTIAPRMRFRSPRSNESNSKVIIKFVSVKSGTVEQVDNHGQIEPPLQGPDIGHIGHPRGVGPGHGEASRQQVRTDWQAVAGIRGRTIAAPGPRAQPLDAHQPGDPLAPAALAAITQFHLHPRTAIAAVVLGIDRSNRNRQYLILTGPRRQWSPLPGIEAGSRYP
jgi:hypothetical protein